MWLFFIFIILSVMHIVYENVMLPTVRLNYKYKLFALRDRLRWSQYNNTDDSLSDVFNYLQGATNNMILLLPNIDGYLLFKTREVFKKDPSLRDKVNKIISTFDHCNSDEVQSIRNSISNIFESMLLFNSGGMFFYVLPIFFIIAFLEKFKSWLSQTMFVPEEEISRIAPAS